MARKLGASQQVSEVVHKAGSVARTVGTSTQTKVGSALAAGSEIAGSEVTTRVYMELTGEAKEMFRQNSREKPKTTISTNTRG